MKVLAEWYIQAPWGKIAMISWGSSKGDPVLLVHGRQDSAITFVPLLEMMPETYYYVGLDLPGHGKSDPFPPGMLSRIHFVTPVDIVVKALGWKKFTYISHSMGGEIGLFYNAVRTNKIKKFIHLDIGIALHHISHKPMNEVFNAYVQYYENYENFHKEKRHYTKQGALDAVMCARNISVELAELVLSRNLVKVPFPNNKNYIYSSENGEYQELEQLYTLAWDKRLKNLTHLNLTFKQYEYLFTNGIPKTLFIEASDSKKIYAEHDSAKLIQTMISKVKSFESLVVEGSHDVHLTNPERLVGDINLFLESGLVISKL